MIVFCTHCWRQLNSSAKTCPYCGADLTQDNRSYEEKLIGALDHPLNEARVRACWLIGAKTIEAAADKLISVAKDDVDMFVRHAAIQALGHLHSPDIVPFLESLLGTDDRWLEMDVKKSLHRLKYAKCIEDRNTSG